MEIANKNEFVELEYTGYANEEMFDSNTEGDLKKLSPNAKKREVIIIIGQGMVVPGLDSALEGKEIGKEYEITLSAKEGFGERHRELVKTIPLKIFREKNITPYPGMALNMDNMLARIITISGGRVITDFNNPLSGKVLRYKFRIVRKVSDEKIKVEVVLGLLFKFVPDFEIGEKVIVKGPKILGQYIDLAKNKFRELIKMELVFEEKEIKSEESAKGDKKEGEKDEHNPR